MITIPIVDFADLGLHNPKVEKKALNRIANKLDEAFSTVGFVSLINHGVDQNTIDRVLQTSKTFFQLPNDVKDKIRRNSSKSNNGYIGVDQEILGADNRHEIKEAYNITGIIDGLFPDDPEFRQAVTEMASELSDLTKRLFCCLALGLGLDENFFVDRHRFMFQGQEKNASTFRTLYYPPLTEADIKPGTVRCGAHSDYGTITLLLQDDVGGLEILCGSDWIPATPIPGSILVNLGDLMQFWTAGRYKATVHRVLVPQEELRRKSIRQSIAFFVHPDNGVMISQLNGSGEQPAIEALDYLNQRLSATYKY